MRDRLRLRLPRATAFYAERIAPRLGRGDRATLELSDWAARGRELVRRHGAHAITFEQDGIWVDDGDGTQWLYTPGVPGSAFWTEFGEPHEREEVALLTERIPEDGLLVDAGANAGSHCVKLAQSRRDLRVLAFEPSAAAFEALLRNAERNGVADRIQSRRVALWDRDAELRLTTRLHGENFVVPDGQRSRSEAAERVPARTLDGMLRDAERVDAIKCDVEGVELAVLRGAAATLERFRPLLMVEIEERHTRRYGHSAQDVFDLLSSFGYSHQAVGEGRNYLFSADRQAE